MKSFVQFINEKMDYRNLSESAIISDDLEEYGKGVYNSLVRDKSLFRKGEVHKEDYDMERFVIILTLDPKYYNTSIDIKDITPKIEEYYIMQAKNASEKIRSWLGIPVGKTKQTTFRKAGVQYTRIYCDEYTNNNGFTVDFYVVYGKNKSRKELKYEAVINITNGKSGREGRNEFTDFLTLVPGTKFSDGTFNGSEYEIVKRVGYKLWLRDESNENKKYITARIVRSSDPNHPAINIQRSDRPYKAYPVFKR